MTPQVQGPHGLAELMSMGSEVECSQAHDWTSLLGFGIAIMALSPRIGQAVKGAKDVYVVAQKIHNHIWSTRLVHLLLQHQSSVFTKPTFSSTAHQKVVIKCAPGIRPQREKEILQQFEGDACIRQLVDHAKEPPCLILEHLQSDALKAAGQATTSRQNVKFIARSILSALASLHAKGIAHTGKMIRVHPVR
jgi:casein kinase II subunit alpha